MALKNSNDNIDIEALLHIAQKPKEKKKAKENPDVIRFIQECKIESGKKRIPTYIIYYQYSVWKKTRLVTRATFFRNFGKKFEKTTTVDGVGYLLNPGSFDLSPQGYFKARSLLRKERNDRRKEKDKKKSS